MEKYLNIRVMNVRLVTKTEILIIQISPKKDVISRSELKNVVQYMIFRTSEHDDYRHRRKKISGNIREVLYHPDEKPTPCNACTQHPGVVKSKRTSLLRQNIQCMVHCVTLFAFKPFHLPDQKKRDSAFNHSEADFQFLALYSARRK